jgi:hypothetical protein
MFYPLLPIELERHILEYDSTYVDYFRKNVIPELMEMAWKRLTVIFFTILTLDGFYTLLSDFEEDQEDDDEEFL